MLHALAHLHMKISLSPPTHFLTKLFSEKRPQSNDKGLTNVVVAHLNSEEWMPFSFWFVKCRSGQRTQWRKVTSSPPCSLSRPQLQMKRWADQPVTKVLTATHCFKVLLPFWHRFVLTSVSSLRGIEHLSLEGPQGIPKDLFDGSLDYMDSFACWIHMLLKNQGPQAGHSALRLWPLILTFHQSDSLALWAPFQTGKRSKDHLSWLMIRSSESDDMISAASSLLHFKNCTWSQDDMWSG